MDKNKITQLSCARKLKDTDPRADMEIGVDILEGMNTILNRVHSLLYQSTEQVSLFALKAGLSPDMFELDENKFAKEAEKAIQFYLHTGVDDITLPVRCEYYFDDAESGAYYTAAADGVSIPVDEEDDEDEEPLCEERIFVTLERRSEQGTYYFNSDGRWEKHQSIGDRLIALGETNPDTTRSRFAEELLRWRPDIGKKTFKKRLAETEMLCKLSDSLPELLYEEWEPTDDGKLIPRLFPMDDSRHGIFIGTGDGKYQIYAYVDADEFPWFDDEREFLKEQCIIQTEDINQVRSYLLHVLDHYSSEDVWSFPLSNKAYMEVHEDYNIRIYLIDGKRELTEEEQKNHDMIMDWLREMMTQTPWSDEDYDEDEEDESEEEEADDEGEEYEDESEYDEEYYEDYHLEMLHSLSDGLPGVFCMKWIHPTRRGRMPVLSFIDEKKHGLAISTEGGEYHVNAYLLTLDVSWYDKGLEPYSRLSCIFTTSDAEKVKQYVRDVVNCKCDTKEDTWLFPISDQAIGKMSKYGDICPIILSGESRELSNEEQVNVGVYDDWYEKLCMSSEWCEDDEEYDEDEEDDGDSD